MNTQIRFSDRPWTGTSFDTSNAAADGEVLWTAGTTIMPGTVIEISLVPANATVSASIGTVSGGFGTTGLTVAGEVIFAYQGSTASPSFVHALNYRGIWDTPTSGDTTDSLLPSSLNVTNGFVLAPASPIWDNGEFQNRNSQVALANYKPLIGSFSNWTTSEDNFELSTGSFTVVPEPSAMGLVISATALGGGWLRLRRKNRSRLQQGKLA